MCTTIHQRDEPQHTAEDFIANFLLRGRREEDGHRRMPGAREKRATDGNDPARDLRALEDELVLADLGSVEQRLDKQRRASKGDKSLGTEIAALERAEAVLSEGEPLYRVRWRYVGLPALPAEQYLASNNWLGVALSALMRIDPARKP